MFRLFYLLSFTLLSLQLKAQNLSSDKSKLNVVISLLYGEVLIVDRFNMASIKTTPKIEDKLIVKLSQGNLTTTDSVYIIHPIKIGKLTVNVFRKKKNKTEFIATKTFKVDISDEQKTFNKLSVKPDISLNGYLNGKIPINRIKQVRCLTINPKYRFLSAEVYISGCTAFSTSPYKLNSICYDIDFIERWSRISSGTTIVFDNIKVIEVKSERVILLPTINFSVVANN